MMLDNKTEQKWPLTIKVSSWIVKGHFFAQMPHPWWGVFIFLLGFYIIGLIFRAVLIKLETKPEEPEEKEEQTEDVSTENEEKWGNL